MRPELARIAVPTPTLSAYDALVEGCSLMAATIAEPPHLAADLKVLRLSTVAAQWQPLAEQALRQRQTPADYLAQLVHLEVTARRERRIQRRIQDARASRC